MGIKGERSNLSTGFGWRVVRKGLVALELLELSLEIWVAFFQIHKEGEPL